MASQQAMTSGLRAALLAIAAVTAAASIAAVCLITGPARTASLGARSRQP